MTKARFARITTVLALGFIVFMATPARLPAAQFQNPIQAIKNAYKQAKQQAKQQEQQAQQQRQAQKQQQQAQRNGNQSSARTATQQPVGQSVNEAGGPITDSECCTPAAMQKFAKQASVVDIVGIKLGMTPKQAFAAVHAFNPKLEIDVVQSKLEVPGIPDNQYPSVPHYALIHTVGPHRQVANFLLQNGTPEYLYMQDGSSDLIEIEFTTPPNPPLVEAVTRTVGFPQGHPVFASTLLAALRKKYGPVNPDPSGALTWIYGPDGKLLQRQLTDQERNCPGAASISGLSIPEGFNGRITASSVPWDKYAKARAYSLKSSYPAQNQQAFETPACFPFTIATATADFMSPNAQNIDVTVTTGSPALFYASYRSTQEWMEAKAEAAQKKEQQSIQKNAAPKF